MFRIDRSSVFYKKDQPLFVLPSAPAPKRAPKVAPVQELQERAQEPVQPQEAAQARVPYAQEPPLVEESSEPAEQLPSPKELLGQAEAQVEGMMAAAHEDAARYKAQAALEADAILQEGYRQGHQEGYESGRREGEASYEAALHEARALVTRTVAQFEGERQALAERMESDCLALSLDIAQKILDTTLSLDPQKFLPRVKRALAAIQCDQRVTVRVSPQEYATLSASALSSDAVEVVLVEDQEFSSGDLVVASEAESVDAGIGRQMKAVREALGQGEEAAS